MFLAGVVLSGVGGVIRGDWIGSRAAMEVELRAKESRASIERRVESLENQGQKILESLSEIKGYMRGDRRDAEKGH